MAQYRKKPVVIEAVQWDGTYEKAQEINEWNENQQWPIMDDRRMKIPTREGLTIASVGDFVIKGVKGEFYACKPDIFEQTYEAV